MIDKKVVYAYRKQIVPYMYEGRKKLLFSLNKNVVFEAEQKWKATKQG